MSHELKPAEIRTLGCLVEKSITTPSYYPLSLNALTNACNQKSNREPVVDYDEKTVVRALDSLRDRKLLWMRSSAGNRVPKYEHRFPESYSLTPEETAVLCVLMLRGPQTVGEIRGRTTRLHPFESLEEVREILQKLISREDMPLVTELPRQAGRKESRFAQLLSGKPELQEDAGDAPPETPRLQVQAENETMSELEKEVLEIREELTALRKEFDKFRGLFE